jgi:hypothetical protein
LKLTIKEKIMKRLKICSAVLVALSAMSTAAFAQTTPTPTEPRVIEIIGGNAVSIGASGEVSAVEVLKSGDKSSFSFSSGPQVFTFQADGSDANVVISSAISDAFSQMGNVSGMSHGRQIKNAPYSAEVINERIQTMQDGNQIIKRTSQLQFRDSAGRTRSEVRDENGETRAINIFDAVEGNRFILTPKTKVASKFTIDRDLQKRVEELREKTKSLTKDGKSTVITGGAPGEEIVIHRSETPRAGGGNDLREEVKVRVIRTTDGAPSSVNSGATNISIDGRAPLASLSGLGSLSPIMNNQLMNSFQDRKWSSKATTRELGSKDIEGVRAEGKVRSYTIPAGEIGNKNPITVTTETWYSPELQLTVYSKHSDPRAGDTIYRLANVKRSEQALSLFAVPDGYQVKEATAMKFETR